jgi:hypothetical protein
MPITEKSDRPIEEHKVEELDPEIPHGPFPIKIDTEMVDDGYSSEPNTRNKKSVIFCPKCNSVKT